MKPRSTCDGDLLVPFSHSDVVVGDGLLGVRELGEFVIMSGEERAATDGNRCTDIFHQFKSNFINTALARATQRTQRFIRWVRVWIYKQAPWPHSIARVGEVWATTSA